METCILKFFIYCSNALRHYVWIVTLRNAKTTVIVLLSKFYCILKKSPCTSTEERRSKAASQLEKLHNSYLLPHCHIVKKQTYHNFVKFLFTKEILAMKKKGSKCLLSHYSRAVLFVKLTHELPAVGEKKVGKSVRVP